MLRRFAIIILLFTLTACEELDVACLLLELAVPNQHYNETEQFEGKLTDFEKWWGQFEGTALGKLLEIALEKSPLLAQARSQLRETAYKYGMKEESVNDMMKNLNEYLKVSVLSPDSTREENANLSLIHVITGEIPRDFMQGNKNYFRLFRFELDVDLFGKNKNWRKSAIADIMSVVEIVKDTFSLIRMNIAHHFVYLKGHQVRQKLISKLDCECHETVTKIKDRVDAGIHDQSDLDIAKGFMDKAGEMVFNYGENIKIAFTSLLKETGITDLAELMDIIGDDHELPKVDQNVFAGTPMSVIQKRSDVQIKLNILKNACGLMGITLADKFPHVVIEGTLESAAKSIFDLLNIDNFSISYGYHVKQNIFKQAAVKSKINMYRSMYEKAQNEYTRVVQHALSEVGTTMVDKSIISRKLELVYQQLELLGNQLKVVKAKVEQSAAHLTEHLEVENKMFMADDEKIGLESDGLVSTIKLVRALGG